jgi:hypothetical protein
MATKSPPAFPLYGDLSEKKMRALGEKLDKLQDPNGFKHYDLLGKHTDGPNPPLLWHLVRCGLVARDVQSAGLYSRLGEYIPADVTAADVITVLRHVPEDMGVLDRGKARDYFMLTPGSYRRSMKCWSMHMWTTLRRCGPLRPSCRARCRWRSTASAGAPAR